MRAGSGCAAQDFQKLGLLHGIGGDEVFGVAGVGGHRQQQRDGEDEAVKGSGHSGVLDLATDYVVSDASLAMSGLPMPDDIATVFELY